jgi:hypothetical protein
MFLIAVFFVRAICGSLVFSVVFSLFCRVPVDFTLFFGFAHKTGFMRTSKASRKKKFRLVACSGNHSRQQTSNGSIESVRTVAGAGGPDQQA